MTNLGNELFIDFIIYLLFKIEFKKIEYWKKRILKILNLI